MSSARGKPRRSLFYGSTSRTDAVSWRYALMSVAVTVIAVTASSLVVGVLALALPAWLAGLVGVAVGYGVPLAHCIMVARRCGIRVFGVADWHIAWLAPVGLIVAYAVQALALGLLAGLDVPIANNTDGLGLGTSFTRWLVLFVGAVVVAPLVEEVVFRRIVLRGLVSIMPAWVAIVVQGVAFGCMHVQLTFGRANIGLVVVLSLLGILLGVIAYVRREIVTCVVVHTLYNGAALAVLAAGLADGG